MRVVAVVVGLGGLAFIFAAVGNAFWWFQASGGGQTIALDPASPHDVYFVEPTAMTYGMLAALSGLGACQLVLSLWSFRVMMRAKHSSSTKEPA